MDRRAPDLARETPHLVDDTGDVERAVREHHKSVAHVDTRSGPDAFVVVAVLGTERKAHEVFVFARGARARERALDYLGGLLDEIDKSGGPDEGFFLPLDYEGRPYDDDVIYVRGEVRDYVAEEQAAALLGEPVPKRALG